MTSSAGARGSASLVMSVLLLAACGLSPTTVNPTTVSPTTVSPTMVSPTVASSAGVRVLLTGTLGQYREDEVASRLQVSLLLASPAELHVTALTLRWPGLATQPTAPDYPLIPGLLVDLPVPYSNAVCGADPAAAKAPAEPAHALVSSSDGATVDLLLADPTGLLTRIFAASCRLQAIAASVSLRLVGPWVDVSVNGKPGNTGSLVVTRTGTSGRVVRITAVAGGGVLLDLVAGHAGALPLVLPADGSGARLPVGIVATGRCDGHAFGESKKTWVFYVDVDPGDGVVTPVPVSPVQADRAQLYRRLQLACGTLTG